MNDSSENPTDAAKRLDAALERIALAAAQSVAANVGSKPELPEVVAVKQRLDALIARLRAGLSDRTE